jgi:hypothetical protein
MLDDLLKNVARVDVMKIDVEGAEPRVLRGAARVLERSPRITLFLELNPSALGASGSSPQELLGLLRTLAFQVRLIDEITGSLVDVPGTWDGIKYVNALAERRK